MSAPFWRLCDRIEDVFRAFILTLDDPGIRVARGFSGDDATEPSVSIMADGSTETVEGAGPVPTGIRDVSVRVVVRSHNAVQTDDGGLITEARDAHSLLVGRVFDLLYRDDVTDQLNLMGIDDLTVQAVYVNDDSRGVDGNSFVTIQNLLVTCHPAS